MTEEERAVLAREGDQDAFEQLVLRNQNRIYSLAVRMTGDREEGYDLAQDIFLRAWQNLSSFQGNSSFSTWLYRLATNLCIDGLRRRKRRQEALPLVRLEEEPDPADWTQEPQRQLERAELRRAVERGLEALPDAQRQILVLRELSGLSYQEIAQTLELDMGTVKSRLARARLALQKILRSDGNLSPPGPSKPSKKGGEPA